MIQRTGVGIFAGLLLWAWVGGAAAGGGIDALGISARNFDQVSENIYRGGTPSAGDLRRLKVLGAKTIIDFTVTKDDSEKEFAEALGLNYINIPWDPSFYYANRYDYFAIAHQFLALTEDAANLPVFVHCER